MIPRIDANAINRNTSPIKQRTMQKTTPFICSEYGTLGFLASRRCAKPNNKVNQLTKSEKRRITIINEIRFLNYRKFHNLKFYW